MLYLHRNALNLRGLSADWTLPYNPETEHGPLGHWAIRDSGQAAQRTSEHPMRVPARDGASSELIKEPIIRLGNLIGVTI